MSAPKQEQIEIAERLQLKWLKAMEAALDEGTITSTDMATLARVLMANGWNIDPSRLPKSLKDKIKNDLPEFDDAPSPEEFGHRPADA